MIMISKYMILWLLRHMQLFCNLESFWLMLLFQTHHYQPNGPIKTNGCHARFKCRICHQLDMFPNVHYFVLIELFMAMVLGMWKTICVFLILSFFKSKLTKSTYHTSRLGNTNVCTKNNI
jgi:hypothetical protein